MRRERDAECYAGDAIGLERFSFDRAVDSAKREYQKKATRHIVLQVMRVPNMKVGHRDEERARAAGGATEMFRREVVRENDRRERCGHAHETPREVEVCRVGKEPLLKRAETVVAADRPARHVERSHDAEE